VLRPIYDWVMRRAAGPEAPFVLFAEAFCEAIFLPIPPDVILAPMILQRRKSAWFYCLLVAFASVLGGCVSYAIGYHLSAVGQQLMAWSGHADDWPAFQEMFKTYGPWIILLKGVTPVPFALVTIASGLAHLTFWKFLLACLVARIARFVLTTFLVLRFGPAIQAQIEKNLLLWGSVAIVAVVLLYVGIHYFMR
jgi:membrane protein YqaA with SNARE-associated domain